jgi:hypothetical protein
MVDVGLEPSEERWRASTHSNASGDCLEVAAIDGHVWVRDSKDPALTIELTHQQWGAFVDAVKLDRLELRPYLVDRGVTELVE